MVTLSQYSGFERGLFIASGDHIDIQRRFHLWLRGTAWLATAISLFI
jgi:hypothetical protein